MARAQWQLVWREKVSPTADQDIPSSMLLFDPTLDRAAKACAMKIAPQFRL
jgi:hypothetical protein